MVKRFILALVILPIFSLAQSIVGINTTDFINCYGDPECVQITFDELDSQNHLYTLSIFRDNSDGSFSLIDIFFSSTNDFALNESFNYCFVENGTYRIDLEEDLISINQSITYTTDVWPVQIDQVVAPAPSSKIELDCFGDSDGSVMVFGIGGEAPLTYTLTGPAGFEQENVVNSGTSTQFDGLSAGLYQILITDDTNCESVPENITISQPDLLQITSLQQSVLESCFNSQDAQIIVNIDGGTAPFQFEIVDENGATDLANSDQSTFTFTGLTGGIYTVNVSDANNCSTFGSIELDDIEELIIEETQITDAPCNGDDGNVIIIPSGGTGAYNYAWGSGTSNNPSQDLVAGNYTINVTDANACLVVAQFEIDEPEIIELFIDETTDVSCFGLQDGAVNFRIDGGTPEYTIAFEGANNPALVINNILAQTQTLESQLFADIYQISITDANGCNFYNGSSEIVISEPDDITVLPVIEDVLCNGSNEGFIEASLSGGYGN